MRENAGRASISNLKRYELRVVGKIALIISRLNWSLAVQSYTRSNLIVSARASLVVPQINATQKELVFGDEQSRR